MKNGWIPVSESKQFSTIPLWIRLCLAFKRGRWVSDGDSYALYVKTFRGVQYVVAEGLVE